MATPDDLDRLRALLAALAQIGNARRGELIRAEDWNTLVGALADVARAVLAADASDAVPAHQHLDQVGRSWLTPDLRELLDRGPLADPAMQQRLAAIEQAQRRLGDAQDGNVKKVEEFRGRLTDVASRDLERQAAITTVRRQLDQVIDPSADLQAMRNSLGAVQRDLGSVLEAASRLSVDGQVVDLGSVLTRVGELEQLRDRFRLANGELLDAATIERRLAEVNQRSVSPDQLQDALNRHRFELSDAQSAALEERLDTRVREQTNGVLETFRGEVDSRVNQRLDGLPGLVQGRVADALPGLQSSLETALAVRIGEARDAAIASAGQAAQQAVASSAAALRGELGSRIDAVNSGIAQQVQSQLGERLAASLAAVGARIDGAAARLDALGGQLGTLTAAQQAQAAQLATIPQDIASLRTELRKSLQDEIGLQVAAVNRSVDERLAAFTKANEQKLGAMQGEIAAQAVDAARKAAVETSQASSAALRTQLLAEMRGIARDELNLAVNDAVRTSVDRAVATQFATVPNLVSEEVKRQKLVVRNDPVLTPVNPGRIG